MIYRLSQASFQLNRTWDNFLGYSNVMWAFSHFSSIYHHGLAHLYPLVADLFNDILLRYNEVPHYLETRADLRTYESMIEFFETNLAEHEEFYSMLSDAIDIADENGDKNVAKDLGHLQRMWNRFMEQAMLLRDKAQIYGEGNKWSFDAFSDQFYTLKDIADELTGNGSDEDD